jgi:hypothetical protein
MQKIQPQSIANPRADHYRINFLKKDGTTQEYSFSISWAGEIGAMSCDQPDFYAVTYDDPATNHLLTALDSFDNAVRCEPESETSKRPTRLTAGATTPGKRDNYKIYFQSEAGEVEYETSIQCVDKVAGNCILEGESGIAQIMKNTRATERLKESIIALHRARHI